MSHARARFVRRVTGFEGRQLLTGVIAMLTVLVLAPIGARAAATVVSVVDGGPSADGSTARVFGNTISVNALPGAPLNRALQGFTAIGTKTPLLKVGGGFAGLSNFVVANRGTSAATVELQSGPLTNGSCAQSTPVAGQMILRVPANDTIGVPLGQAIIFGSAQGTACVFVHQISGGLVTVSFAFWNISATTFELQ